MKFLFLPLLALLVAGCTSEGEVGGNTPTFDQQRALEFAANQIRLYNSLGIDPIQLPPEDLIYGAALCGTLIGLAELVQDQYPVDSELMFGYCEVLLTAAGPAPVQTPIPIPKPTT